MIVNIDFIMYLVTDEEPLCGNAVIKPFTYLLLTFFNGGDFGMFGGGREGNSHPLSPNLKVELGGPSLLKERRDGEESCKVHILTVRDGSSRGLCQVASQRGLAKNLCGEWQRWLDPMG